MARKSKVLSRFGAFSVRIFSVCFILAGAAAFFWWRILFNHETIFYDNIVRLFYPYLTFFAQSLRNGEFPLWNPFIYSGIPFLANMQSACLYPFSYLFIFFDFPQALSLDILMHTFLGGLFMYGFCRDLGQDTKGSMAGAFLFMLNGFFVLHVTFVSQFSSYVWLPLILFFVRRGLIYGDCRYGAGAALGLTLQCFAGHPQFLAYTFCAIFIFGWLLVYWGKVKWRAAIILFLTVLIIFFFLSAIQILPSLELASLSIRKKGLSYEAASLYSLHPLDLFKFFLFPLWNRYVSPVEGDVHIVGFYFGWLGLMLALLGAAKTRRFPETSFILILLITAIGFSLGKYFYLYKFLYDWMPGLQVFRYPAQAFYLAIFAISVLAGYGITNLGVSSRLKNLILCLIFADLFLFGVKANAFIDRSLFMTPLPVPDFLKKDTSLYRVFMPPVAREALGQSGNSQLEAWIRFMDSMYPNLPMAYGISDVDGYEELRGARYEEALKNLEKGGPGSAWMKLLNIKYLFSFWDIPDSSLSLDYKGSVKIFRNLKSGPRAFYVSSTRPAQDEEALRIISSSAFNPYEEVLIAPPQSDSFFEKWENTLLVPSPNFSEPRQVTRSSDPYVRVGVYKTNRVHIEVSVQKAGYVVLADSYFPGWHALVNGKRVPVERVNYILRGVAVQPGHSSIEMYYRPFSFCMGAVLSIFGIFLALLSLFIFSSAAARRRR